MKKRLLSATLIFVLLLSFMPQAFALYTYTYQDLYAYKELLENDILEDYSSKVEYEIDYEDQVIRIETPYYYRDEVYDELKDAGYAWHIFDIVGYYMDDYNAISLGKVYVMQSPYDDSARVGTLSEGEAVTIVEVNSYWGDYVRIEWPESTEAYVNINHLSFDRVPFDTTAIYATSKASAITKVNVRTGPSIQYPVIGQLASGQMVSVSATVGDWTQIEFAGRTAYVSSSFLQRNDVSTVMSVKLDATVYSGAGNDYERIGNVAVGQSVRVNFIIDSWAQINFGDRIGYVNLGYLNDASAVASMSSPQDLTTSIGNAVVIKDVNVRIGPSSGYEKIGSLKAGQYISIMSIEGNWAMINYNGLIGFVSASYISLTDVGEITVPVADAMPVYMYDEGIVTQNTTMYIGPGRNFSSATVVPEGEIVDILEYDRGWVKVRWEKHEAYIMEDHITHVG